MKETNWRLSGDANTEWGAFVLQFLCESAALGALCLVDYTRWGLLWLLPYLVFARWARNARYENRVIIAPGDCWDPTVEGKKLWNHLMNDPRWSNLHA